MIATVPAHINELREVSELSSTEAGDFMDLVGRQIHNLYVSRHVLLLQNSC